MINEAFFLHVDECDECSWVKGEFCLVARSLLDIAAKHAAERLAPIPVTLPRPEAKA